MYKIIFIGKFYFELIISYNEYYKGKIYELVGNSSRLPYNSEFKFFFTINYEFFVIYSCIVILIKTSTTIVMYCILYTCVITKNEKVKQINKLH
jgi:hypothetical protein